MMARPWLSHFAHYCSDTYFYLRLEGAATVAAIVDLFRWTPASDTLRLRLTVRDRAALVAFINDGNLEFEVPRASARAFAQFILRRLREEENAPVPASENRLYPEGENHAEKSSCEKIQYQIATGRAVDR